MLVDFDFTLDAGEFVVVTGPSGAGKSTLLHIAGGLDAPDSGTVAVARPGRVVDERRRARGVPAAQPRIRVPVLQLGADADRGGERVVAAGARRYAGPIRRRPRRGATGTGRARRPRAAPAGRTVGRTDATGGGGARAGGPAVDHPRRRADRKPGQPLVDRGLGSPALAVGRRRRGGRHGDPRPGRGALRLPRAAPCRRACVRSRRLAPVAERDATAARRMDVLPADPPRRVDRRLAPDAAQRDRRRARGDGGPRGADTQIRARPPVRLIRPVAHPRRRRRGGRGYPERQRPACRSRRSTGCAPR